MRIHRTSSVLSLIGILFAAPYSGLQAQDAKSEKCLDWAH